MIILDGRCKISDFQSQNLKFKPYFSISKICNHKSKMSIRQDYLKKQIDQLGKVVAKLVADLMGLKSDFRITEAEELVNTVFEKELGFNFDEIVEQSNENLISFLNTDKKFSQETMEDIANIIFELGMVIEDKNKQANYFQKAILLFEHLNTERKTFSFDFMVKINKMKELI